MMGKDKETILNWKPDFSEAPADDLAKHYEKSEYAKGKK